LYGKDRTKNEGTDILWIAIVICQTVVIILLSLLLWKISVLTTEKSSQNLESIKQAWTLALTGKPEQVLIQDAQETKPQTQENLYAWDDKNSDPMLGTLSREEMEDETQLSQVLAKMRAQDPYYNQPEMENLGREMNVGSPNPFQRLMDEQDNGS
jgi:hypothetical protein